MEEEDLKMSTLGGVGGLNESEIETTQSPDEIRCYLNASSPTNRTGKPSAINIDSLCYSREYMKLSVN